jgi:hypothetical protein
MLIWSGRSLHLNSMGSEDMGKKSMSATASPSDSASARTAQLPINPKQPLETLVDQTSKNNAADDEGNG